MANTLLSTLGVLGALAALSGVVAAAEPSGAELERAIERLSVVGNVLYVAAHPDDENTRLLAYLVHERGLATTYLSLTRGDGGQNLLGPEQGPALGLIRTQELLRARGVDGAMQRFGRARDFGYSKSPEETLRIWDRAAILADVVWTIRVTKPDVIITRFSPTGTDTHGHHTASAILALEAWRLAADPKYAPEQVKLAGTWQAKRVVWNHGPVANASGANTSGDKAVTLDVGGYDAALGRSYGEIAAQSRTMHKSQGMGSMPSRTSALETFTLLEGEPMTKGVLDGVTLDWSRVPGSDKLRALLAEARAQHRIDAPWKSVDKLMEARAALDALPDGPWKSAKRRELDAVIAWCSGVFVEASAKDPSITRGGSMPITLSVVARTPLTLELTSVTMPGARLEPKRALERYQGVGLDATLPIAADARLSNPYWLDQAPEPGLYPVADQALVGLPELPPPYATFTFRDGRGGSFAVDAPIDYKWLDPIGGEQHRALEVLPAATLTPSIGVMMFADDKPRPLRVVVQASAGKVAGTVTPEAPAGFTIEPKSAPFSLDERGAEETLTFTVHPPKGGDRTATLKIVGEAGGERLDRALRRVEYPHIPIQTMLPPAEVRLVRVSLQRGHTKKIGYVPGAGDDVAAMLSQVGYDVTLLDDAALRGELSRYDAIVLGVRAYNTNHALLLAHDALDRYVAHGGVVVAQYSTANRLSRLPPKLGPYPFTISQERVTDENADVTFEAPRDPALQRPNPISGADFAGWVQERGLYFASQWDPAFHPILSMHDRNEAPRKGGLLVARHGKGAYIYTGLSFFRQLPAGVPGAFRLFANLLSYGR